MLNKHLISNFKSKRSIKSINLNFGPQHPAAHGVLRLVLQLDNETVQRSDVHIGLLHRGSEKLIESKPYLLSLPYFDRMDYVSVLVQEHAYCLAVEKLMKFTNFTQRASYTRTIFDELTRILNHLLATSCHALDVGSMSPLFWAFEEREKIMEFYESVSGARFHAAYYRPTISNSVIPEVTILKIIDFLRNFETTISEMSSVLNSNLIWKQRLVNIGSYSYKEACNWSLTGVMARCTGIKRDVRLMRRLTYGNYYFLNVNSYIGRNGDSYDRYLIRMAEMVESSSIILKAINASVNANTTQYIGHSTKDIAPVTSKYSNMWSRRSRVSSSKDDYNGMEHTISHFKSWSEGISPEIGITLQTVESPKGEFTVTLMSDGTGIPHRCKVRSPAYHHIQFLPRLLKGTMLADLVTLIGTVDIVFGEIDR